MDVLWYTDILIEISEGKIMTPEPPNREKHGFSSAFPNAVISPAPSGKGQVAFGVHLEERATGWFPRDVSWFINPINYSYIRLYEYHEP